jgi:hypothetical protein
VAPATVPPDPDDDMPDPAPGVLGDLARLPRPLQPPQRQALRPFIDQLRQRLDAMRDR